MDLDVLGLNSTFASSDLEDGQKPKVDTVETSDIEGPEDFTMNMTYWMTADLTPKQQIRSRKEANTKIAEVRGDAMQESDHLQDTIAEGDRAVIEQSSQDEAADLTSTSQTIRKNDDRENVCTREEPVDDSMENDEKVRSYLSALPDTDIGEDALTSTPLRIPRQNLLQVPSPIISKARSLQATVEDYDTPRKPTQETVIHHPPESIMEAAKYDFQKQLTELQSRLDHQELTSKLRITELESLLSYTRSDLDAARNETYNQKELVRDLQNESEKQRREVEQSLAEKESQLKTQEKELGAKMEEFGKELQLQNLAKLQDQKADFDLRMKALEEAKRLAQEDGIEKDQLLDQMESQLSQLRESHKQELLNARNAASDESQPKEHPLPQEHKEIQIRLSALQSRANSLQADLEKATIEARSARQEAQEKAALHASVQGTNQTQQSHITDLESRISSLQRQLDSAQASVDTKDRQLQDSADLEERLQCLQTRLEDSRADVAAKEKQLLQSRNLESQIQSLQTQLDAARADAAAKDQQMLRHIEEQEQSEQRLNTAQGRVQSLENTVSTLRQQLAEAHRDSAKARTDAEQFEQNLEDANERLQDSRAEADRRVADVERKLAKLKESKLEAESRFKELQSQHDDLVEAHETELEGVRSKAEDAIRKAVTLLDQERSEKKRTVKELKKTSHDLERLRAEVANKAAEDAFSDEESSLLSSIHPDAKDAEIENLRTLLRKQSSALKTLKTETSTLRKETTRLKTEVHRSSSSTDAVDALHIQLSSLRRENEKLVAAAKTREEDLEAVNKAMDERLAAMLSKVIKERARSVVGKRDGQWADSVGKANSDRELMGKVLMREWGKQEVGVADKGEDQPYRYKYVQRS
jgi:chromosome segregation ATPase